MKIISVILINISLLTLVVSNYSFAHSNDHKKFRIYPENSGAKTEAGKIISKFHKAIKLGQKKKAKLLLDANVMIFKNGIIEKSADQYEKNMMVDDMKYFAKLKTEVLAHSVNIIGDMAYSTSHIKSTGQVYGSYINSENLESMVLKKFNNKWKIVHIHRSN